MEHMHTSVIKKIEIFEQCSSIEISFIVNRLSTLLFLPGDVIIRQGEESQELFFIIRGSVDIEMQKLLVDKKY